ncbi:hypothetical protein D3C80_1895830 [compost metagenome]
MAAFVDLVTLCIHYIIVFQQALTDTKVIFFYFFLCTFDRFGDHTVLQYLALFVAHSVHQGSNTLRTK